MMEYLDTLWAATRNERKPKIELEEAIETDVAIVGGGFTGILTAYFLKEMGIEAIVLEQDLIGQGASGTNGGMLIPMYKSNLDAIAEDFGLENARRMFELQLEGVELIKSLINKHQINCSLTTDGYFKAFHDETYLDTYKQYQEFLFKKFNYESYVVGRDEVQKHLKSDAYCGGYIEPNGMSFHPLNYLLGIADVVKEAGVMIYENTEVTQVEKKEDYYTLKTPKGSVKATKVVIATNGYTTDITPVLKNSIIPKYSYVIATEKLDKSFANKFLPSNKIVSDTREALYYFRQTPDSRILFGGSIDFEEKGMDVKFQEIHHNMLSVFPELADYKIEYKWRGKVAITPDSFPHIGQTEDGLYYALGYNGRGAILATLMGKLLALNVKGEQRELNPLESLKLIQV